MYTHKSIFIYNGFIFVKSPHKKVQSQAEEVWRGMVRVD